METKICIRCKEGKPLSEFSKNKKYHRSQCKKCRVMFEKERYAKKKECILTQRREQYKTQNPKNWLKSKLKCRFGVTYEKYLELFDLQSGVCAICKRPNILNKRLAVDHKENLIRGLLCDFCNKGLGLFRDDPKILQKAIEYLNRWLQKRDG
jgi:hypothetical protein